ncbi:MAG: phage virion morphogenesis protein [Pseudomonadota bacterium]|nr:phage virion morphogenesis protein [Pseudomonadota bacterium]
MLQLKLSTKGFDLLFASLGRLEGELKDLTPVMALVGRDLRAGMAMNWAADMGGNGVAWAALRPTTVAIRESRGYPGTHPILRRSGSLQDSVAVFASSRSVVVGSPAPVAGMHQTGYHNGSRYVPARPLVGITAAGLQQAARTILDHINNSL